MVFPIVGLGASAGGLEALEAFLKAVPPRSGLAFVVVQHLDPKAKGMLPELLQRHTAMPVARVKDRTRVRVDHVYVIPPDKDLSLRHGVLRLSEPVPPRGLRLPIDFFLRSLAEDRRDASAAVILSGMGSDGALGIRAIKEQAGVVLVQEPGSARFDGMPRSAVATGLADIVAPVEQLPGRLLECLHHAPPHVSAPPTLDADAQSQLEKILLLLRRHTGNDFALYKRNTLSRRIERRMGVHQITKVGAYVRYLRENAQELDLLFKELLIGVTRFFRDPAAWDQLRDEALPPLLASRADGHVLRVWAPGCSTGEEAYSLAIVCTEAMERVKRRAAGGLQVFATDLDRDAIERARQGLYPENIVADVSPDRLGRFFVKEDRGYRLAKEIREAVIFAPQNLVMDPPFTKLDLLCCRNLLIYFEAELQKRLIALFHYCLNPGGVLFLGSAETIGEFGHLFAPLPGNQRVFRRLESVRPSALQPFPAGTAPGAAAGASESARPGAAIRSTLQVAAEEWLHQHHAPSAVLVTDHGDIVFVSGRTGRYLEPAAGKANWNVFAMARDELRYELSSAFQKGRRDGDAVTIRRVRLTTNGERRFVDLTICPLSEPEAVRGLVMIVFTEAGLVPPLENAPRAGQPASRSQRVRELERALDQARKDLQRTREEMQSTREEFRSVNEELQSANEELQSANEELTTSKEEMQSLNEELQTVNAELQIKLDELSTASNDMSNLLNSTEIATVFLDGALRVRRFTEQATRIIQLIPGDVGRPVTDLASELLYPELADDARQTLRTLVPMERSLRTRDGHWFAMRLLPYRTIDDRIDGVVMTFTDTTVAKQLEEKMAAQLTHAKRKTRR